MMGSQFVVVIELPDLLCSPYILQHIEGEVREFFNRFSSGYGELTGQRLRATIGPWEAQHQRWPGERSAELHQNTHNDASTSEILPSESFDKYTALETGPLQDGRVDMMVPQQGLGGQVLVGERRDFEERLAQEVASKAPNILFPDYDYQIPFDAAFPPLPRQPHLYESSLHYFDTDGLGSQLPDQIPPLNVTSSPRTLENVVSPQIDHAILVRAAANNLSAGRISKFATPWINAYPRLQWMTPLSPGNYSLLGPGKPSESRSMSRKRG